MIGQNRSGNKEQIVKNTISLIKTRDAFFLIDVSKRIYRNKTLICDLIETSRISSKELGHHIKFDALRL